MQVVFSRKARDDILEIIQWHRDRDGDARTGIRLARSLKQRADQLGSKPDAGRPRDDLVPGLRSVLLQRYMIFFRVRDGRVEVAAILHSRRDIGPLLKER